MILFENETPVKALYIILERKHKVTRSATTHYAIACIHPKHDLHWKKLVSTNRAGLNMKHEVAVIAYNAEMFIFLVDILVLYLPKNARKQFGR